VKVEDDPKQNNATKIQSKVKTIIFFKMENDLNFFLKMEDYLKKIMLLQTIKSKNNDCGTAPGNLVYTTVVQEMLNQRLYHLLGKMKTQMQKILTASILHFYKSVPGILEAVVEGNGLHFHCLPCSS
jgi:hypothetical protein